MKKKKQTVERTNEEIKDTVISEEYKKSELCAKDCYDFNRLALADEYFIPFTWEEEKESVVFHYNIEELQPFAEIRKEDGLTIYRLLIGLADIEKYWDKFSFSLEPDNLFYNENGKICIKKRDLYQETVAFPQCYKALTACVLTNQYGYMDFLEGGDNLLKKDAGIQKLYELKTGGEIRQYLVEKKEKLLDYRKNKLCYVKRNVYRRIKVMCGILFMLTVGFGAYAGYQYFYNVPYLETVCAAGNAYIENDDLKLIETLKVLDVDDMELQQKYTLARAYVQSESLSTEQKDNILSRLTLSSNQKELDYWICLGRKDVEQAKNLAMQLSDDELLLYAYMKEKAQVEDDITIDGTQKQARLNDIQSQIEKLAKQYEEE